VDLPAAFGDAATAELFLRLTVYEPHATWPTDLPTLLQLVRIAFYADLTKSSMSALDALVIKALASKGEQEQLKSGLLALRLGNQASKAVRKQALELCVGGVGAMTRHHAALGNTKFTEVIGTLTPEEMKLLLLKQDAEAINMCEEWQSECEDIFYEATGLRYGSTMHIAGYEECELGEVSCVCNPKTYLPAHKFEARVEANMRDGNLYCNLNMDFHPSTVHPMTRSSTTTTAFESNEDMLVKENSMFDITELRRIDVAFSPQGHHNYELQVNGLSARRES
jgi:hypothetical protein